MRLTDVTEWGPGGTIVLADGRVVQGIMAANGQLGGRRLRDDEQATAGAGVADQLTAAQVPNMNNLGLDQVR